MPKVIVYNIKRYDPYTDETSILPRMATREGARALGGEIIEGTAVEIDVARLEHGERFTPPDFEPSRRLYGANSANRRNTALRGDLT
jgi:cytosine/adenosine deaminase-related metal-dependent hydrolase